mmetsp:Transcript_11831/g.47731  ORF Transcript_11831/g.47731 Transcript_11831/m.47731 type:complete len:207 (+) Transcript_11831:152-772(+)
MFDSELRTVPSYWSERSSSAFMRRRAMYPVCAVLTAVSTRPSRPPMVWKKNSVAERPATNEFLTKPLADGSSACAAKCGSVRSTKPLAMRLPSTACWPRQAIICDTLSGEPLAPHSAIVRGAFERGSASRMRSLPAFSRTAPSRPVSSASSDCAASQPGLSASRPAWKSSILALALASPSATTRCWSTATAREGVTSPMPIEKPRW